MTEVAHDLLTGLAGTWQLDPKRTTVELHTTAMWGRVKVVGTVDAVQGSGTIGDEGAVSGELVLDAASIDTGIRRRDKHLRGKDFLDVSTYPTLTFTASEATSLPDGTVVLKGSLQVKDQTHPIEVVVTLTASSNERITIGGAATIDRRHWGVSRAPLGAGLANQVLVTAEFVRREAPGKMNA
jgi:polyisoprenoid-binding protein YceI